MAKVWMISLCGLHSKLNNKTQPTEKFGIVYPFIIVNENEKQETKWCISNGAECNSKCQNNLIKIGTNNNSSNSNEIP